MLSYCQDQISWAHTLEASSHMLSLPPAPVLLCREEAGLSHEYLAGQEWSKLACSHALGVSSPRMPRQGMGLALLSAAVGEGQGQLCTVLRHQHCSRRKPRPGMSSWLLFVSDSSCCRAKESDMAPGDITGQDLTVASSGLWLFLNSHDFPVLVVHFFIVYTPFCFFSSSLFPLLTCSS